MSSSLPELWPPRTTVTQIIQPMTIDIGIILDVTPQIAEDGTIIMNIHPSITDKTGEKTTPDGKSTFPLLSVRETDTTVRVRDGQTIIIAGLMQEKTEENLYRCPRLTFPSSPGGAVPIQDPNEKKFRAGDHDHPYPSGGKEGGGFYKTIGGKGSRGQVSE